MATGLEEGKPFVDLEKDGIQQVIPPQDILQSCASYDQTKL